MHNKKVKKKVLGMCKYPYICRESLDLYGSNFLYMHIFRSRLMMVHYY